MDAALEKGAQISCITSGGSVAERARREHRLDLCPYPRRQPATFLSRLFAHAALFILHKKGLIGGAFVAQLRASIDRMRMEEAAIKSEAQEVTDFFSANCR